MYVTVIQNISVSMQSVSSLCDSLKHLILTKSIHFFLRSLLLSATLYQKQTLLIRIYLHEIDTDITYPIDACRRWTSIPALSDTLRMKLNAALSHTHIYLTHRKEFTEYTQELFECYIK